LEKRHKRQIISPNQELNKKQSYKEGVFNIGQPSYLFAQHGHNQWEEDHGVAY
jgi:hypothetical protein